MTYTEVYEHFAAEQKNLVYMCLKPARNAFGVGGIKIKYNIGPKTKQYSRIPYNLVPGCRTTYYHIPVNPLSILFYFCIVGRSRYQR